MKSRLAFLLLIVGGVIASLTYSRVTIPAVIISIAGGFLCSFCFYLFTSIYGGTVWGMKVKCSAGGMIKQLLSAIGLIAGGFSIVLTGLLLFTSLLSGKFIVLLINLVGFVLPLAIAPYIAKLIAEKSIARGTNALHIGNLGIFEDIDNDLSEAVNFVVGFEGVALFSDTDYCYAVYLYNDYQLGDLSTPKEVALVGTYFVQKYHDRYTFKVDVEVIPGEPGRTVVAVGTGGIGVARIQGTPDKRIFRSYIFSRKKNAK